MLPLYACGRTTGVVLDSGNNVTHAAPIFEGHLVRHAIQRVPMGGRDLTTFMFNRLQYRGYILRNSVSDRMLVADLKEKLVYVAPDFESELRKYEGQQKEYELPDGRIITIGKKAFRCAEVLFDPTLAAIPECLSCQRRQEWCTKQQQALHCLKHFHGRSPPSAPYLEHTPYLRHRIMNYTYPPLDTSTVLHAPAVSCRVVGVHHALHAAIMCCRPDIRKGLCANISLGGGNTLFPGLSERISREMRVLMPTVELKVIPPENAMTAWFGGSILACMDSFQRMYITQEEYGDYGPTIVHITL